ncbi:MAG: MBL fold metallo-hydrolase [Erythrobacter sp.]
MFVRSFFAVVLLTGCAATMPQSDTPRSSTESHSSDIVRFSAECEKWDDWEEPAKPFQIHEDTYYVGTCGIAAILIAGDEGHILIDSGTEGGARQVLGNIRQLGFDPSDIVALLHSHEHFDHVGGMAYLQQETGATVYAHPYATLVLRTGSVFGVDPQAGTHDPMEPVTDPQPLTLNEPFEIAGRTLRPWSTIGHSPGALSWQWDSCGEVDCRTIVYADSLSPVSRDDYRFSDHPEYVANYRLGIARVAAIDCHILLTPHPSHSRMVERAATGSFEGGVTCPDYAASKLRDLEERLAKETETE